MKRRLKITGLILLGFIILCYVGFATSRYRANRIADNIMDDGFGPGVVISWSGEIQFMSPQDLISRLEAQKK